jgi:polysaccharide biosynthesis/export protein
MRYTLILCWGSLIFLLATSCVPQRKLLLLQENPQVGNQGEADKLLRSFELQQQTYTLKPGDVLSLKVQSTTKPEFDFIGAGTTTSGSQDPILSGYTLDAAGNMLLPVVGKVNLSGLSLPEARAKLTEVLQPHLTEPTVNIRLLTFRFTILGEVSKQGQYITYQDNINFMEAIAMAGGFSSYSDRGRIRLIRYEAGIAKLYTISLLDDDIIGKTNYYLQPNDMIVIDPLPAKFIKENLIGTITLGVSLFTTFLVLANRFL